VSHADTIAAIATASGAGGIGVIRLSGAQALVIATGFLSRRPTPRFAHRCHFHDASGILIDDGLLLAFPGPASFTGEDVAELQTHGSPIALSLLLKRCIELGARQAKPGEFSERAYLNNKIDLAQAEAIADLIASGSEAAARAAQRSLSGEFSERVNAVSRQLIELRVYVEAAIDFPEEEVDFLNSAELRERFAQVHQSLQTLLAQTRRGQRLRDGLHLVILGAPNAGKSSLLNALAGYESAIVTPIPGTTRDLLREHLQVDGMPLTVVDTAGLRESQDPVEMEGIRRASVEAAKADLLLLVSDSSTHAIEGLGADARIATALRTIPRLHIHNKIDVRGETAHIEQKGGETHIHLSARNGDGVDLLRQALRDHAGLSEGSEGLFSARARHVAALERTATELDRARAQALDSGHGELAAEDLNRAHQTLSEILGQYSSDDLLGAIFSSFCIGK